MFLVSANAALDSHSLMGKPTKDSPLWGSSELVYIFGRNFLAPGFSLPHGKPTVFAPSRGSTELAVFLVATSLLQDSRSLVVSPRRNSNP